MIWFWQKQKKLPRVVCWEKNSKNTAAVVWIWCILHHLWLPGCYSSLRASSHSHITHQPDSKLRLESQTTLQKKQRSSNSKTIHCCLLSSILFRDCTQKDMCFSAKRCFGRNAVWVPSEPVEGMDAEWKLAFKLKQTLPTRDTRRVQTAEAGFFYVLFLITNMDFDCLSHTFLKLPSEGRCWPAAEPRRMRDR